MAVVWRPRSPLLSGGGGGEGGWGGLISGLLLALAVPASLAEEPPRSVRVATRVLPPMVIDEHGRLTGTP